MCLHNSPSYPLAVDKIGEKCICVHCAEHLTGCLTFFNVLLAEKRALKQWVVAVAIVKLIKQPKMSFLYGFLAEKRAPKQREVAVAIVKLTKQSRRAIMS